MSVPRWSVILAAWLLAGASALTITERSNLDQQPRELVFQDHFDTRNDDPRLVAYTTESAPLLESRLWVTKILSFAFDCRYLDHYVPQLY